VTIDQIETAAGDWARMISSNTANVVLTTLSAIFERAQRKELAGKPNNAAIADRVKVSNEEEPDEEVKPEHVYNQEELRRLINATAPGSFERVLVMVPALTGLRIGEVLGLTWPYVNLKANQLHVRLNLVDKKKGRELKAPKSKSSRRTLDLPQELVHELKVWKLKCPPSIDGLVFATMEGKRLHRKAGKPYPRCRDCRGRARETTNPPQATPYLCIPAARSWRGYSQSIRSARAQRLNDYGENLCALG